MTCFTDVEYVEWAWLTDKPVNHMTYTNPNNQSCWSNSRFFFFFFNKNEYAHLYERTNTYLCIIFWRDLSNIYNFLVFYIWITILNLWDVSRPKYSFLLFLLYIMFHIISWYKIEKSKRHVKVFINLHVFRFFFFTFLFLG